MNNIDNNYRPSFFDIIEPRDPDYSFRDFCEFWASWHFGGKSYVVCQINADCYQKTEIVAPEYIAVAFNIIRLVCFPLTIIAAIFKVYYRYIDEYVFEAASNPHAQRAADDVNPNLERDPDEVLMENALNVLTAIHEGNIDWDQYPPIIVDEQELSIHHLLTIFENSISLEEKNENEKRLIKFLTVIFNNVLEMSRNQQQAVENEKDRIEKNKIHIEHCTKAWQIANTKGIDCSDCCDNDMAFIGKLTNYLMLMAEPLSGDLAAIDKDSLFDIFIFDIAQETKHKELDDQENEIMAKKMIFTPEQNTAYNSFLNQINQIYGQWISTHRQNWNIVLQQGMLAADQA